MHRNSLTWVAMFGVIALMFLRLPQMAAKQDSVLNTYSALVEVDALARQQFVEPIDGDVLVHGAIRGMMRELDPYSGYIAPDELPAFQRRSRGGYVGVGLEVGIRGGQLSVIAPFEGSPAARAGVLAGDVIMSVNGQDVEGWSVFDVVELLVGEPGTMVRLRVLHPAAHAPEALTIVRGPVSIRSIRGFRRGPDGTWEHLIDRDLGIAYVGVSNFSETTTENLEAVIRELASEGLRGLVIDLRFNPGGLMHQAIAMVDLFIDDGILLSTVNRRRAVEEYRATRRGTMADVRLAVLINGSSASSAEIVAGVLQARGRAVVVGERSFGKGSVQHVVRLTEHEAAVTLTTAYYRLPNGRVIHRTARNASTDAWGVVPDIPIALSKEEVRAIEESRRSLDLAFLDRSSSDAQGGPRGVQDRGAELELRSDRQLAEALRVLRQQLTDRRAVDN